MVTLHKFIILNGNASLYLMECLNEKFSAKETSTHDLKVSFNHTLSSLLWDLSIFLLLFTFIFSFPLLPENGNITSLAVRKIFLLEFYPSLLGIPFILFPLGSKKLIGFQYLVLTNASSSSNWMSPNNIGRELWQRLYVATLSHSKVSSCSLSPYCPCSPSKDARRTI